MLERSRRVGRHPVRRFAARLFLSDSRRSRFGQNNPGVAILARRCALWGIGFLCNAFGDARRIVEGDALTWLVTGSLPLLELSSIEQLLRPEEQTTVFRPSEIELNKVSKLLIDEVSKRRPARIVFDSLSEFRLLAETPLRYRRELLNLKRHFAQTRSTVLLLDDKMDKGHDLELIRMC